MNNNVKFEDVVSFQALMKSADECSDGVKWKASVQMFLINKCLWAANLHQRLVEGTYQPKKFTEFYINERGKIRFIQANHISDRCVQKALCNNALKPIIEPLLISENPASRKDMGTHYMIKLLRKHLAHHYRKYKDEGGILLIDLHDYFHSINQDILLNKYKELIKDERIYNLTEMFIRQFKNGGLGLGSEVCQISAIFYANDIDHYVKEKLHIQGYGRYMDDSYLISNDIEYLKECLNILRKMYSEIGIELNPRKTKIVKFKNGHFEFMKKRIHFSETGKIIMRPVRDAIYKRKRKLRKQKQLLDEGKISLKSIIQSYSTWRGQMIKYCDCYKSIKSTDRLFLKLFNVCYDGADIDDIRFFKNLEVCKSKDEIMDLYNCWYSKNTHNSFKKPLMRKIKKRYKQTIQEDI